jgi:hypothetical protein
VGPGRSALRLLRRYSATAGPADGLHQEVSRHVFGEERMYVPQLNRAKLIVKVSDTLYYGYSVIQKKRQAIREQAFKLQYSLIFRDPASHRAVVSRQYEGISSFHFKGCANQSCSLS